MHKSLIKRLEQLRPPFVPGTVRRSNPEARAKLAALFPPPKEVNWEDMISELYNFSAQRLGTLGDCFSGHGYIQKARAFRVSWWRSGDNEGFDGMAVLALYREEWQNRCTWRLTQLSRLDISAKYAVTCSFTPVECDAEKAKKIIAALRRKGLLKADSQYQDRSCRR